MEHPHHLELYYATMGVGLVCHTLNPRLTTAQLAAMINEAEDRVLAVAADLRAAGAGTGAALPEPAHIIVMDATAAGTEALPPETSVWNYEDLLDHDGRASALGSVRREYAGRALLHLGHLGRPKGVLYTHRSNYLHTLRSLQADGYGTTARDVMLVAAPMFHANGWGVPFAAPAVGAQLVLPGRTNRR